jgi:hypothetical protein
VIHLGVLNNNMENQQQPPQNTPLCRGNCGFYGSPATEDLCSKCFKDMIQRKQETGTTTTTSSSNTNNAAQRLVSSVSGNTMGGSDASTSIPEDSGSGAVDHAITPGSGYNDDCSNGTDNAKNTDETSARPDDMKTASQATITSDEGPDKAEQLKKPKNRCRVCNKRVGLTGFDCRCGGLFCATHRYDTAHDCTFDYKTAGREQLRKSNPQVVSEKIQPI